MREVISTPDAPTSPLYSQGVRTGSLVLVSGMVGIDANTGDLAGPTIQEQTRQALTNCHAVLRAAEATLEDVIEVGVLQNKPSGCLSGGQPSLSASSVMSPFAIRVVRHEASCTGQVPHTRRLHRSRWAWRDRFAAARAGVSWPGEGLSQASTSYLAGRGSYAGAATV